MVHVTRKDNESSTAMIRRFSRRVQRAGIILEVRKGRFFARDLNRTGRRKKAARREKMAGEYDRLYKLGKLEGPKQ